MKKIGILGGTFDPFHNQHLNIAKTAYQKLQLDEVWILPTKQNPLKDSVSATNEQRVAMINLVINDYPWLKLNEYELTNSEPSYTINTVTYFTNTYCNYKFYFIIGSDNLYTLNQWQGIEQLINLVKIVVVNRPHFRKTLDLMKKYQCRNLVVSPSSDISSAKIRNGEVINQLDSRVNNYINDNLLYNNTRLQFNLDEKRTQHCFNVGEMARKLAIHYKINPIHAQIAGNYHDLCKQWSKGKMTRYLTKYNKDILREPFPVWHGYVAALYLKNHYLVTNDSIINAIAKHTTGAIMMTELDLIVLLADKISIERSSPHVEQLRTLAFKDLTLAFKFYLKTLKTYLESKNQPLNKKFLTIYESWINKE
ncbi:nicotinate-nucleotide adenylyltransferase [Spiroplasma sp. AdecLV25b]|uniref:nicotinate-nucleotide adenylyltransferase n=1 Tax=Spiroplasma sp. AdecLV25b TaxID=3027162 RepID=UPI0027DFA9F3|nr:nicotinate-nucleotide adenylyltransferase [Spiroplasma sp. AdecLV25b]